mmetsp:Transcript_23540/g.55603  ORF Transcript_23540/g.55603 Transcript_23540/m.55603 type:complete len:125 (+) Transcript_23540:115-489(+)
MYARRRNREITTARSSGGSGRSLTQARDCAYPYFDGGSLDEDLRPRGERKAFEFTIIIQTNKNENSRYSHRGDGGLFFGGDGRCVDKYPSIEPPLFDIGRGENTTRTNGPRAGFEGSRRAGSHT